MKTRYFTSATLASAMTFALLFLMQHLISLGDNVIATPPKGPAVELVKIERDEEIKRKPKLPEPPEDPPVQPPVVSPPVETDPTGGPPVKIEFTPPEVNEPDGRNTGFAQSGELLPIVAVAPAYPARALARHLEGYVVVEYTVTVIGGVRDAFVVTSSNSTFDRPALEAAYKFKYKPRVVDGLPVETPGVRRKFSFVLDD